MLTSVVRHWKPADPTLSGDGHTHSFLVDCSVHSVCINSITLYTAQHHNNNYFHRLQISYFLTPGPFMLSLADHNYFYSPVLQRLCRQGDDYAGKREPMQAGVPSTVEKKVYLSIDLIPYGT